MRDQIAEMRDELRCNSLDGGTPVMVLAVLPVHAQASARSWRR